MKQKTEDNIIQVVTIILLGFFAIAAICGAFMLVYTIVQYIINGGN